MATGTRDWFVLHVKPRTEKKVMQYLSLSRGFRHLPVYVKVTKVQRRKVRRELPIFPGYVFAHLSPDERRSILQSNLVVRTIPVLYPREMIHQLRQIAHAGRGTTEMRPTNPFKEGDYVRVKYGPMRGTEGYVKREGAKSTIVLNVAALGTAVEVTISPEDVELVSASPANGGLPSRSR